MRFFVVVSEVHLPVRQSLVVFFSLQLSENVKMDGVHLTAIRIVGLKYLVMALQTLCALVFQSEDPTFHAEQIRDNFLSRMVVRKI